MLKNEMIQVEEFLLEEVDLLICKCFGLFTFKVKVGINET